MCAISGYYLLKSSKIEPKKLVEISFKLLEAGQSRGTDACGFYAAGKIVKQGKSFHQAKKVQRELKKIISLRPRIALFHNRLATQGSPTNNANNHPLKVENWVAIHNGIITNYLEKRNNLKLDWDENAVDSLLIPHIINRSDKKTNLGKIRALKHLSGSLVCGLINEKTPKTLYLLSDGPEIAVVFVPKYKILLFASTEDMIKKALSSYQNNWLGFFKEGLYCPAYIKTNIGNKIVKINEKGFKVFETWEDDYMGYKAYNEMGRNDEDSYKNNYASGYNDAQGVFHSWSQEEENINKDWKKENYQGFDKALNDEIVAKNIKLKGI